MWTNIYRLGILTSPPVIAATISTSAVSSSWNGTQCSLSGEEHVNNIILDRIIQFDQVLAYLIAAIILFNSHAVKKIHVFERES